MSEMSLDEFLGHETSGRGGKFLKKWQDNNPPRTDIWLHTRAPFVALWRHPWPRIVERDSKENPGEKSLEVWGGHFNCWEAEGLLRSQYRRDKKTDVREVPPVVCPMCLLIEHVRALVRNGELSWVEPVFEFTGDKPDQGKIIHAGGLWNAFGADDHTPQDWKEMKDAGISPKEAWKENTNAKCSYVFRIVEDACPDEGVKIAVETTALGDAVKKVIRDQIESMGETEGNPLRQPYALRWEYREKEIKFNEKYRVIAMPKIALTPAVQALITGEAPDISQLIARSDIAGLRAVMEKHLLLDIDLGPIFAPAEAAMEQQPVQQAPATRAPVGARAPVAPTRRAAPTVPDTRRAPAPAPRRGAAAPQPTAMTNEPDPLGLNPNFPPTAPPAPAVAPSRAPAAAPQPTPQAAAPAAPPPAPVRRRAAPPPPPAGPVEPTFPEGTVIIPCDKCGAKMAETDAECWKCGAKYELEDATAGAAEEGWPADDPIPFAK